MHLYEAVDWTEDWEAALMVSRPLLRTQGPVIFQDQMLILQLKCVKFGNLILFLHFYFIVCTCCVYCKHSEENYIVFVHVKFINKLFHVLDYLCFFRLTARKVNPITIMNETVLHFTSLFDWVYPIYWLSHFFLNHHYYKHCLLKAHTTVWFLSMWSLHVLPVSVWVHSRCFSVFPVGFG